MVKISLSKDFYSASSVKQALKDYKEICTGDLTSKDRLEIELKPKSEINNLAEEFCNYVLALEKNDK